MPDLMIHSLVKEALEAPGHLADLRRVIDEFLSVHDISIHLDVEDRFVVYRRNLAVGKSLTYAEGVGIALKRVQSLLENQIFNLRPEDDTP